MCGGRAERLGLPFAKELLPIEPGVTAIDRAISLVRECGVPARVVAVLRPEKTDIFAHLAHYADSDEIVMVHQRSEAWDATSAAASALPLLGQHNVVLLPDHLIENGRARPNAVARLFAALTHAPVAFLAAPVGTVPWASSAGVLKLERGDGDLMRVTDFAEHPNDPECFDAVWVAVGFTRERAAPVLRTMERAKSGERLEPSALTATSIAGAAAVMVDHFLDIGDWPRLVRHWRAQ